MKKILFSIAIVALSVFNVSAQIDEGHVKFNIDMSSTNPEMEMQLAMWQGSTFEVYFSGDLTRTEMNMGSMMKISNITSASSDKALMLMSGMMGDIAVKLGKEDMESSAEKQGEVEITFADDTKEIQGYNCKKAISTDEEGNESAIWYTEEIKVNKIGQNYLSDEVPGFPLEFELNRGELKMTMSSTEFNKKLDKKKVKDLFSIEVPEGYKEMSIEELGSMGGM